MGGIGTSICQRLAQGLCSDCWVWSAEMLKLTSRAKKLGFDFHASAADVTD